MTAVASSAWNREFRIKSQQHLFYTCMSFKTTQRSAQTLYCSHLQYISESDSQY